MEILGAVSGAITIAGLFRCAVEAFDAIGLYRKHPEDFEQCELKLSIEQCRLYAWGEAMGLLGDSPTTQLGGWQFEPLVKKCLTEIIRLFVDSEVIRTKYGGQAQNGAEIAMARKRSETSRTIAAAFDDFNIRSMHQMTDSLRSMSAALRKTQWIIHDRKKFLHLVDNARGLIDGLRSITQEISNRALQEAIMANRVRNIKDVGTLDMIAAACETDHPRLASTAISLAESMSSGRKRDICEWQTSVDTDGYAIASETFLSSLENMTITEMKHRMIQLEAHHTATKRLLTVLETTFRQSTHITDAKTELTIEQMTAIAEEFGKSLHSSTPTRSGHSTSALVPDSHQYTETLAVSIVHKTLRQTSRRVIIIVTLVLLPGTYATATLSMGRASRLYLTELSFSKHAHIIYAVSLALLMPMIVVLWAMVFWLSRRRRNGHSKPGETWPAAAPGGESPSGIGPEALGMRPTESQSWVPYEI